MFVKRIVGEVNGRDVVLYSNKKYKITAGSELEGILIKCDEENERFLIQVTESKYWIPFGEIWIPFSEINNIEEI